MLTTGIKQHSFKGPKPGGSGSFTKNKRYTSLSGLFKSDSSTSLHDVTITKPTKKKRQQQPNSREKTVIPLLGRDGSIAALLPERPVGKDGTEDQATKANHLRFPLLSPNRRESGLFFRMKTMQNAERFTNSLPEGLHHVGVTETYASHTASPQHTYHSNTIPTTRGTTRGGASIELEKVPPSRERISNLEKQNKKSLLREANTRKAGKREKVIVSSKYGYHSRSNSATYKRLDKARFRMDDLLEAQVVKATSTESEIPNFDDGNELTKIKTRKPMNSYKGISTKGKVSPLPFNLDSSIYSSFKENKDLGALYKKAINSSTSSKSHRSSAKSLTIVLPMIEKEPTNLESIPTERSVKARPTTPYDQYIEQPTDQNVNPVTTVNDSQDVCFSPAERPNTSDDKMPLSLDSMTHEEIQNIDMDNGKVLPNIRRSITFDTSLPSSPKKRQQRSRRSRRTHSKASSNNEEAHISFLIDDSKSITPSQSKARRQYRPISKASSNAIGELVRSRATSKASENRAKSNFQSKEKINTDSSKTGTCSGKDSRTSQIEKTEETDGHSSIDFVQKSKKVLAEEVTENIDDGEPKKYTPLILSDSEDELGDDFENI